MVRRTRETAFEPAIKESNGLAGSSLNSTSFHLFNDCSTKICGERVRNLCGQITELLFVVRESRTEISVLWRDVSINSF